MIFDNLKELVIPEGNVIRIEHAGEVLWERIIYVIQTITGTNRVTIPEVTNYKNGIVEITQYGKTEQSDTPAPSTPVDIVCNNGTVKWGVSGTNLLDMAEENIRLRYYINDSGAEASNNQNFYNTKFIPVKPNTTYTLSVSEPIYYSSIMEYDNNKDFLQRTLDGNTSEKHSSMTFITRADTAYILVGSNPSRVTMYIDDVTNIDWMLNEGSTALPYELYTESIITDGTPEVLSAGGLNLFYNDEAWDDGFFLTSGKVAKAGSNRTFITRCSPNTTYYWKHCSLVGGIRAFTVDEDEVDVGVEGTWIKQNPVIGEINEVYSATTGANAKWLCVCFGRNQSGAAPIGDQWSDFMLSIAPLTADTPYEPYTVSQTASVADLLAVGDYEDTQEIISGAVTRKIRVKALTGKETMVYTNETLLITVDDIIATGRGLNRLRCTHYRERTSGDYFVHHNYANNYLYFHNVDITSLADWQAFFAEQYAAGTPVIVLYPLVEETIESTTPQTITASGTTTISANSNYISDIGLKVDYYGVEK